MSDKDLYARSVRLIRQMSPEYRDKLCAYMKSLKPPQASQQIDQPVDIDTALHVIKVHLARRGVDTSHIAIIKNSSRFDHCRVKIQFAWDWCKKQSKNKIERNSIFLLACRCLEDFLTITGVPTFYDGDPNKPYNRKLKSVGLYDIAMYADFIPQAVEVSFPGYTKSGLLKHVALRSI